MSFSAAIEATVLEYNSYKQKFGNEAFKRHSYLAGITPLSIRYWMGVDQEELSRVYEEARPFTVANVIKPQQALLDPRMFDNHYRTLAEKRVRFGLQVERIIAAALGASLLSIDGRCDVCPDMRLPSGTYVEAKSCGQSGQFIIYEWRREKDQRLVRDGARMLYAVLSHGVAAKDVESDQELLRAIAASSPTLLILTLKDLLHLTADQPKNFNHVKDRGHGYTRTGYLGGGWRVPFTADGEAILKVVTVDGITFNLQVHGLHKVT